MDRKVILYISTSLDGYIAKPNDDLSFLSLVQQDGEDYGYSDFVNSVDTVIIGRKTYDWVMTQVTEFPHADKNSFIITRTARPGSCPSSVSAASLDTLWVPWTAGMTPKPPKSATASSTG